MTIRESILKYLRSAASYNKHELDALQGHKLEAGDFRAIVTKDPAQTLLRWVGDPDAAGLSLFTS